MYWHRLECSLGRSSLVGTTVQAAERLPRHLVADEKHTTLAGKKVYLAATAGGGCCLGMALAETAGERRPDQSLRRVPGRGPIAWTRSIGRRRSTPTAGPPPRRPGGRCSRG